MSKVFLYNSFNLQLYNYVDYEVMKDLITHLHDRIEQPLPGRQSQLKMAAYQARASYVKAPDHASQAGVLMLFYPRKANWHIVLIERTSRNPKDRHKGQIAFPGGRYEEQDNTLARTAVREAEEEVGIDASSIQLIGGLTPLYIPVSNYNVEPYVGFTNATPTFIPQEDEVASILEVPLSDFLNPATLQKTQINLGNGMQLQDVPFFNIQGKIVWGATAMMLNELIEMVKPQQEYSL
ncbi:MAG: CoA pyrophosphatase [Bacteroidota bacterium]